MSKVTIYHNPRCSKSRQTMALLQQQNITPDVVLYLQTPLSVDTIVGLRQQLGMDTVKQMMRTKETLFKELQLADASEEDLVQAISANPKLLERPIVVANNQARIGRPPEQVLDILA